MLRSPPTVHLEAEDRDGAASGDRTGQGSTLARNSARAARMLYD